jgi:hypothetical protein
MPTYLITGCQGKVGVHVVEKCRIAGIHCVGIDLVRGIYDAPSSGDKYPPVYIQADLQDAGVMFSTISRFKPDVVVHIAAIPDPTHNPPHVVFQTNTMSTFNVIEACVRLGVPRLVNISSEQVRTDQCTSYCSRNAKCGRQFTSSFELFCRSQASLLLKASSLASQACQPTAPLMKITLLHPRIRMLSASILANNSAMRQFDAAAAPLTLFPSARAGAKTRVTLPAI